MVRLDILQDSDEHTLELAVARSALGPKQSPLSIASLDSDLCPHSGNLMRDLEGKTDGQWHFETAEVNMFIVGHQPSQVNSGGACWPGDWHSTVCGDFPLQNYMNLRWLSLFGGDHPLAAPPLGRPFLAANVMLEDGRNIFHHKLN